MAHTEFNVPCRPKLWDKTKPRSRPSSTGPRLKFWSHSRPVWPRDSNISAVIYVVLGKHAWSLVLKDKIAVLGPCLGLEGLILGPGQRPRNVKDYTFKLHHHHRHLPARSLSGSHVRLRIVRHGLNNISYKKCKLLSSTQSDNFWSLYDFCTDLPYRVRQKSIP